MIGSKHSAEKYTAYKGLLGHELVIVIIHALQEIYVISLVCSSILALFLEALSRFSMASNWSTSVVLTNSVYVVLGELYRTSNEKV